MTNQPNDTASTERPFYFKSWYTGEVKEPVFDEFPKTAKLHVTNFVENKVNSVLDIGCGAGGILLTLQQQGVEHICGIDASEDAIELAKNRFSQFGTLDQVELQVGNATDLCIPKTEGVSLHRVLCCYPNAIGLLSKAIEQQPQRVILTFPRKNLASRILTALENLSLTVVKIFKPSFRGLRGYLHSPNEIQHFLSKQNYSLSKEEKTLIWHTWVFEKAE